MPRTLQDLATDPLEPVPVRGRERGFALVLALALLSFLFLLVLALVSHVGVESRLAESRKAYSLARANAKLGLLVAIGELQEHAGPDQRVTATASILDGNPEVPEVNGVAQPYWTGVWKRDPGTPLAQSGQDSAEPWDEPPDPDQDPHPEMELTWLVSGNEGKNSSGVGNLHPITTNLPDPDYSQDTVWLVNEAVLQPAERVMALKSPVNLSYPDEIGSSTAEPAGSYAYWVGDEGVKTKVNLPEPDRMPDAQRDFLLNQARFEVSPGPNLDLAERQDLPDSPSSLDLASMNTAMLGKVMSVPQLHYASSGSDENSTKDYFHHLTTDAYGVLSDVLLGGLKRDLTAGLGDDTQFGSKNTPGYLNGKPIFKDRIRFRQDFDPTDWTHQRGYRKWIDGFTDEVRLLHGPLWDYLRDYYLLFKEVKFDPGNPLEASLSPRPVANNNYPPRSGEFWTDEDEGRDPRTHPITPLLLEVKVGHTLEMVPTGDTDDSGAPLYRARIAIYPSLALWNPYNVELEAAEYELFWWPDPKFWVYATRQRDEWAEKVMAYEVANDIPKGNRLWDKNEDGKLTGYKYKTDDPNPPFWDPDRKINFVEYNAMHCEFLGDDEFFVGADKFPEDYEWEGEILKDVPQEMDDRWFHLYRHDPNDPIAPGRGKANFRKSLLLRTAAVRLAPGEKLYFTLAESQEFNPAEDHVFKLTNHLSFQHHLKYDVPLQLCPPIPGDEPVTFVYTRGGSYSYTLGTLQWERKKNRKNTWYAGTTLSMIKNGERWPIKEINYAVAGTRLRTGGSYQDYGRADIVEADPSRVIGPRLHHRLTTYETLPQLIFVEHNPRSLVDSWHLGNGEQWGRGQATRLREGIGDVDKTDDVGVVSSMDPNKDESLSGDSYSDGGKIYYGYQGHSFDVAGFQRVSKTNNNENQWLPRSTRAVLFDVPRQPLMSLASLQHVNLCYFGNSPSYAIGNSYATTLVSRNRKWTRFNQLYIVPLDYPGSPARLNNDHQNTIIDYSYYANEKLWDGFFFSTVPTKDLDTEKYPPFEEFDQDFVDAGKPLPNPRMVYYAGLDGQPPDADEDGALRDFQKAAANLMVDGAFNVNSTSVEAWKAQLGSLSQSDLHIRNLQDDNDLASDGHKSTTLVFDSDKSSKDGDDVLFPFPRLSVSMGEPVNPQSGDPDQDYWTGFAALNEDQLQRLAEEIVEQVKRRGPFLSMGDFVNRRLTNSSSDQIVRRLKSDKWPNETEESRQGLRGALQAAIHDARINDAGFREKYEQVDSDDDYIPANVGQFNPFGYVAAALYGWDETNRNKSQAKHHRWSCWGGGYDASIRTKPVPDEPGEVRTSYIPQWPEFNFGEAPENMLAATNGVTGAMMPGWLSQADVLTSLAPVINARSDTFRVRAYGDVGPDYPNVKIWCEAIVQRVPEYVVDEGERPNEGDPPYARPMEPYEDLNGNGQFDAGEAFTDYDADGSHSFNDDYGDLQLKNPDNERFGRRFRITRFRWLSADEI